MLPSGDDISTNEKKMLQEIDDLRDRISFLMSRAEKCEGEYANIEEAMTARKEFLESVLDSLPANIAVLDSKGTIIFVNQQWMTYGIENKAVCDSDIGIGANYLDVCRNSSGPGSEDAKAADEGITAVLEGRAETFRMEYPCFTPDQELWSTMHVMPLKGWGEKNIIVFHIDTTQRKQQEEQKESAIHEMRERMKELSVLYQALTIVQQPGPIPDIIQKVVAILPLAWQYPEITSARVVYKGMEVRSANFKESQWMQESGFRTLDGERGMIQVFYREPRPDEAEGPFQSEERDLIDGLSKIFRSFLNRRMALEAKSRLAAIVEYSDDAIISKTLDGVIRTWNASAEKMYGYSSHEAIGRSIDIIVPDDRAAEMKSILEAVKQGKSIEHIETTRKRKDGRIINVSLTVSPIKDEYDQVTGVSTIARNIGERKKLEESLWLTQFAVDHFTDPSIWIDGHGRIRYVNEVATKTLGYSRDELLGMFIWDVDPLYSPEKYWETWDDLKRLGSMKFESAHKTRDGKTYPVEVSANYIIYDDLEYLVSFIREISERKRSERILRESEERYRLLLEQSFDAVIVHMDKKIVFANKVALDLIGAKDPGELLGKPVLSLVHPDYVDIVRERFLMLDAVGRTVPVIEEKYIRLDGSTVDVEATAIGFIYGDKHAVQVVFRDISGRKRTQNELVEAKSMAELYLDLMSHDINNMNQAGIGYIELALDTLALDENGRNILNRTMDALRRSTKLIENVGKIQKLRTGSLTRKPIDICQILLGLKEQYSRMPGRTVNINIKSTEVCMAMADELITDVFSNLIENAIKHSDPERPLEIDISLEGVSEGKIEYNKVIVADNGPGIPDPVKSKLFARFQRGDTHASGKGLGLYLVRSLVGSYEGRVWVENRVAGDYTQGSRFVVMLPAIKPGYK